MNTYLKYKPIWQRIMTMGFLIFGSSLVLGLIASLIMSRTMGISLADVQNLDLTEPGLLNAQRLLILVNSLSVFVLPCLLYAYFADPRPMRLLRLDVNPRPWHWAVAAAIVLIAMPSAFWLGELNKHMDLSHLMPAADKWIKESEEAANKFVESVLETQNLTAFFINLLLLAALPAFGEELLFRGLIQKGIMRSTRNVWLSIFLSAFIFSAAHFQFLSFLTRFEMGIILGALFWYTGSLWVSMLAHFVFNGIQVAMAYYKPDMKDTPPEMISAGMVGLSFLLVVALIVVIRKTSLVSMYEVFDDEDDFDFTVGPKDEYLH